MDLHLIALQYSELRPYLLAFLYILPGYEKDEQIPTNYHAKLSVPLVYERNVETVLWQMQFGVRAKSSDIQPKEQTD